MAAALMALKPEKFKVSQKGNPDTLLFDFNENVKKFERFYEACSLNRACCRAGRATHGVCNMQPDGC